MKIAVVGTSNSIVGEKGFLKYLRQCGHEVLQLSTGRSPIVSSIKTILQNLEEIEKCDFLLIDHYVNDLNFYKNKIGETYDYYCEKFYLLLSSLNTRVINILFPIIDLKKRKDFAHYLGVIELSSKNNITVVDLNKINFKPDHYIDPIHLSTNTSYIFGVLLEKELNLCLQQIDKPTGGGIEQFPFEWIDFNNFSSKVNQVNSFKNSIMEFSYISLDSEIEVKISDNSRLISIGYFLPKGAVGESGVVINNSYKSGFSSLSKGYFNEMLDSPVTGTFTIAPLKGIHSVPNLMGRPNAKKEVVERKFNYCYLKDCVILNTEVQAKVIRSKRLCFEINIPNILEILSEFPPSSTELKKLKISLSFLEN